VIAFKFLREGAVGRFSHVAWPQPLNGCPGEWVDADHADLCREGIHACRAEDLLDWIDEELWRVELRAPVVELQPVLVSTGGRLVERVGSWTPDAALALAEACVLRARERAVATLRREGRAQLAERLAAVDDPEQLRGRAGEAARSVPDSDDSARACAFAADAAALLRAERPDVWPPSSRLALHPSAVAANLAFVVAHAAGATSPDYARGYADERAWQAAWLADRLGIV
jgi:hypothetical protein